MRNSKKEERQFYRYLSNQSLQWSFKIWICRFIGRVLEVMNRTNGNKRFFMSACTLILDCTTSRRQTQWLIVTNINRWWQPKRQWYVCLIHQYCTKLRKYLSAQHIKYVCLLLKWVTNCRSEIWLLRLVCWQVQQTLIKSLNSIQHTFLWDVAPYGLVEVPQRLWRTCLHHQAVHSFERRYASNQTTRCHIEEGQLYLG